MFVMPHRIYKVSDIVITNREADMMYSRELVSYEELVDVIGWWHSKYNHKYIVGN